MEVRSLHKAADRPLRCSTCVLLPPTDNMRFWLHLPAERACVASAAPQPHRAGGRALRLAGGLSTEQRGGQSRLGAVPGGRGHAGRQRCWERGRHGRGAPMQLNQGLGKRPPSALTLQPVVLKCLMAQPCRPARSSWARCGMEVASKRPRWTPQWLTSSLPAFPHTPPHNLWMSQHQAAAQPATQLPCQPPSTLSVRLKCIWPCGAWWTGTASAA